MFKILKIACAIGAMLGSTFSTAAPAAAFSCKVVRFIVPYPPGGSSDLLARMLVPGMAKRLNTNIIVENKAGASGNIGTAQVSAADGDGWTWLLGNSTNIVISRNIYKLTNDPTEFLVPVAEVAAVPMVLYTNSEIPVSSFKGFVDFVKSKPEKISYASPGSGSTHQILSELLKMEFGLKATHIPYKGSGPAIQDVMAGHVDFAFEGTSAITPHLSGGKIRPLAMTGAERSAAMPDVPTFKELGYPKFVATNWYGVFLPAKTPASLVARINVNIREALNAPEVVETLRNLDSRVQNTDQAAFVRFVNEEIPRWKSLIDLTGIKAD